MFGDPKTRKQLQDETQLRGKALTAYLKTLMNQGALIRRLVSLSPLSKKRHAIYQSCATQLSLMKDTESC